MSVSITWGNASYGFREYGLREFVITPVILFSHKRRFSGSVVAKIQQLAWQALFGLQVGHMPIPADLRVNGAPKKYEAERTWPADRSEEKLDAISKCSRNPFFYA